MRRFGQLNHPLDRAPVVLCSSAGRGEEDVEAMRVDEERIADRVAYVGDAKRPDRGVVTNLEAVDDAPAPQHCLVAQRSAVEQRPAAELELLEHAWDRHVVGLAVQAHHNPDRAHQARDRSAARVQPRGVREKAAPGRLAPRPVKDQTEPGCEPGQKIGPTCDSSGWRRGRWARRRRTWLEIGPEVVEDVVDAVRDRIEDGHEPADEVRGVRPRAENCGQLVRRRDARVVDLDGLQQR